MRTAYLRKSKAPISGRTSPEIYYYAIPRNYQSMKSFWHELKRSWYRTLMRPSQKSRMNWKRMDRLVKRWLPAPRILHLYPEAYVTL